MKKYRGLLVTFWFPPVNTVAGLRMKSFVQFINENENIRLEVLCPEREGENALEEYCHYSHKQPNSVFYSHQKENLSIYNKLKNWFLYDVLKLQHYFSLRKGLFFHKAMEKLEEFNMKQYDFILCSHGPIDAFKVGYEMKVKYPHLKLILDYRDHISFNPLHSLGIWKSMYLEFEKNVLQKADLVVGVSTKLINQLSQQIIFSAKTKVVYNGFFSLGTKGEKNLVQKVGSKPIISHTGALYGGKRSCDEFFSYYKEFLENDFELHFGVIDFADQLYLEECQKKYQLSNVHIHQNLKHEDSLELIKNSASCLLVLSSEGTDEEYLPVKMFEYIQFERPIIFCGNKHKSEAYELLKQYNCGDHFKDFNFLGQNLYSYSAAQGVFSRRSQADSLADSVLGIVSSN